jgi:hypothetical protein
MRSQETTSAGRLVLLAMAVSVAGLMACGLFVKTVHITFAADRTSLVAGECTTLRWHVPEGDNVVLNGQPINPSGQMDVCPTETTTYQLRVGTDDDANQQEITIVVEAEAGLPTPSAPEPSFSTETPTPTPTATSTPTKRPTPTKTPAPTLSFTFSPTSGPVGSDVTLYLSTAIPVTVYYEGRVLSKRVLAGGTALLVTIPGDASSGYFELRWDGQSVRATQQFVVTPLTATLTLSNNSGQTVWYVYISPADQPTWGDDWLGAEVIASGSYHVFSVPPGTYDLKAEGGDHSEIDIRWGVSLSGSYNWIIEP